MKEHLSQSDVDRYRERSLSPGELLTLHDHIALCTTCCRRVAGRHDLRAMFGSLQVALKDDADNTFDIVDSPALETTRAPFRERFRAAVGAHPFRAAVSGVAVLLLGLLIWFFYQRVSSTPPDNTHINRDPDHEASPSNRGTVPPENKDEAPTPTPAPRIADGGRSDLSPESVVELVDGSGRVILDARGTLAGLDRASPRLRNAVRLALSTQTIEKPAVLARLTGKPAHSLGPGAPDMEFKVLGPVGTVVESDRPTLQWQGLADAKGYRIQVVDSKYNIVSSEFSSATEVTLPVPLRRGATYSWQVAAVKGDEVEIVSPRPPAGQARFTVLGSRELALLEEEKARCGDSHLARGLLYAQAGLLESAESELQKLVDANQQSEAARRLLQNVRAWRSGNAAKQ